MISEMLLKSIPYRQGFHQVFSTPESGYHRMAFFSARCTLVIVHARSIGYVGDG